MYSKNTTIFYFPLLVEGLLNKFSQQRTHDFATSGHQEDIVCHVHVDQSINRSEQRREATRRAMNPRY